MTHGRPWLAAQLPRRVSPLPGETITSYLRRLAQANHLDPEALRSYIHGGRRQRRRPVPVDRLAIAAGVPATTLEHAIADLDDDPGAATFYIRDVPVRLSASGPACQLCALARGATQTVWCRTHPEQVICLRHRRWIGSTAATTQLPLDGQPDIMQAHKQHLRLVRRFGREEVTAGFAIADHICRQWHAQHQHDDGFLRRMRIFHSPGWPLPAAHPAIAAAAYPQVVALDPADDLTTLAVAGHRLRRYQARAFRPGNPKNRRIRLRMAPAQLLQRPAPPLDHRRNNPEIL